MSQIKVYISCPSTQPVKKTEAVANLIHNYRLNTNVSYWIKGDIYDKKMSDYNVFVLMTNDNSFNGLVNQLPSGCARELIEAHCHDLHIMLAYTKLSGEIRLYDLNVNEIRGEYQGRSWNSNYFTQLCKIGDDLPKKSVRVDDFYMYIIPEQSKTVYIKENNQIINSSSINKQILKNYETSRQVKSVATGQRIKGNRVQGSSSKVAVRVGHIIDTKGGIRG
jgi:hypothetical protein